MKNKVKKPEKEMENKLKIRGLITALINEKHTKIQKLRCSDRTPRDGKSNKSKLKLQNVSSK